MAREPDLPQSAFGYAKLILVSYRLVVGAAIVVGGGGLLAALFSDYVAESRFLPEGGESRYGQLAGMAAQFGIDLGAAPEQESPELWVELLKGRELLTGIVLDTISLPDTDEGSTPSVAEVYGIGIEADSSNINEAVDKFRDQLEVRRSSQTGMITVRVSSSSPLVAEEINRRLLAAVNEFNVSSRTRRARVEREFVEERLAEAEDSLRAAEMAFEEFLESNRTFDASARLRLESSRHERAVQRRQEIVTLLAQVVERARIDEVRTLPVISIVDRPDGSARRSGRPALSLAVGGLLGALGAILWILTRASLRVSARNNETEARELFEVMGRISSPTRKAGR